MGDMFKGARSFLFKAADNFRKKPTQAEDKLWTYLRCKPLGVKFRRQHPYLLYILDFYGHSIKLAIEVDGNIHKQKEVRENDITRQKNIERTGLKVLRITNHEIESNFQEVTLIIENTIRDLLDPGF